SRVVALVDDAPGPGAEDLDQEPAPRLLVEDRHAVDRRSARRGLDRHADASGGARDADPRRRRGRAEAGSHRVAGTRESERLAPESRDDTLDGTRYLDLVVASLMDAVGEPGARGSIPGVGFAREREREEPRGEEERERDRRAARRRERLPGGPFL